MHPKKITLTILPMKIWWIEPIDMVYAMPMKGQHNLCVKVRKRHSHALNFAICWKEPPLEKASYAYAIASVEFACFNPSLVPQPGPYTLHSLIALCVAACTLPTIFPLAHLSIYWKCILIFSLNQQHKSHYNNVFTTFDCSTMMNTSFTTT